LGICTQPGRINETAERLAACAQISHVLLTTGRFDIIAWCQFREREELSDFLLNELGTIPGLQQHVDTQLVLNQVKAYPMLLANDKEPLRLKNVAHDLDDLDLKLINELQRDARQKPVHIAQKFGVSDTTILRRTKRLVDEQIIRMVTFVHPFALGYDGVATIGLMCDMDKTSKAAEAIAAYTNVQYVFISTGQYNISTWVMFQNLSDLGHFIDVELSSIPGLRNADIMIIHRIVKTSNPYPL
jgi:Lrp/AsnC family transcriptional regulator for asnA, asnC and gidA